VAIVEDHPGFRETLGAFVAHLPDFELADTFGVAEPAIEEARRRVRSGAALGWDLLLMDIELPRMSGIEATRRLRELAPELPIVVLTVFESPAVILEAIAAGASGYVLKKTHAKDLAALLRSVTDGGAPMSPSVAATLLEFVRRDALRDGDAASGSLRPSRLDLTDRESDVLRRLVAGRTYARAAEDLGVSESTIRTHVRAIYRKLQVHSVAAAVRKAVEAGLV
jgi:DNA-binding NarL/FixJ family response regulator